MITAYVVLDGFDIGAGAIYLFVARTSQERRAVLRAIGPVWDGNEVWLLAAGGTLYFAFPLLYASSFSGFYLPLMMVLWLLMLRAMGIEFRTHMEHPVWLQFFDVVFCVSSALLAIFFGAALGNVIRGVPLGPDGYFFEALWTNFKPGPNPGILDWYTVMTGVVALLTLTVHGALYVAVKTENEVNRRAMTAAAALAPFQLLMTFVALVATFFIRPQTLDNYKTYPVGFLVPFVVLGSVSFLIWATQRRREKDAFLASTLYIAGMLVGAVFALYPVVLPASAGSAYDLTITNTAAGDHGLRVGFIWWAVGLMLALVYFIYVYRTFRGKVRLEGEGY
jgi:cytochrome d ubiquinol oxidase subunit II